MDPEPPAALPRSGMASRALRCPTPNPHGPASLLPPPPLVPRVTLGQPAIQAMAAGSQDGQEGAARSAAVSACSLTSGCESRDGWDTGTRHSCKSHYRDASGGNTGSLSRLSLTAVAGEAAGLETRSLRVKHEMRSDTKAAL